MITSIWDTKFYEKFYEKVFSMLTLVTLFTSHPQHYFKLKMIYYWQE
jgi:hypothetical protein